jgi:hypothetical protein
MPRKDDNIGSFMADLNERIATLKKGMPKTKPNTEACERKAEKITALMWLREECTKGISHAEAFEQHIAKAYGPQSVPVNCDQYGMMFLVKEPNKVFSGFVKCQTKELFERAIALAKAGHWQEMKEIASIASPSVGVRKK